jgi:hypothetical protein
MLQVDSTSVAIGAGNSTNGGGVASERPGTHTNSIISGNEAPLGGGETFFPTHKSGGMGAIGGDAKVLSTAASRQIRDSAMVG